MVRWFSKFLEDFLKGDTSVSYTMMGEDYRSFIMQGCSNAHSCYMALVEYSGGSSCSFIFKPKEKQGEGWRRFAMELWELALEGRGFNINKGGAPLRPLVVPHQQLFHSYNEVLEMEHLRDRPRGEEMLEPWMLG